MAKKTLSKDELIAQLKALSETETPESVHMGAMCYSPAPPPLRKVKCESCGNIIDEFDYMRSLNGIKKQVKEIQALGYDAKVEHICADCANKLGIKDEDGDPLVDGQLYYIFYFKAKGQEQYTISESSDEDDYKCVLAFLKNEPTYMDYYDNTHLVKEELDIIERMTGISID